jgi:hypothetical protein
LLWIVSVYVATLLFSVALFCGLIVALPARYFAEERDLWIDRHPVVRWLGLIGKNVLGVLVIILGVLLSLPGIPGQGLLTIAVGLMLLNLPGKRRLVWHLVRRPGVLRRLNRLRAWFGRPPLVV